MKLEIIISGESVVHDLDSLATAHSGIITIGRKCNEVWNAIPLESEAASPFQCHIIGTPNGPMRLHNGQERTECPKGLMSPKLVPCNGCMGRCVNLHPGRPKYYLRTPDTPTLVNSQPIGEFGHILQPGDIINLPGIEIKVVQ